ncbi:MAG TPA: alpha-ketoacid dehydrogenase subunit beta [Chloroflexota bacterium]|jgi:pyruvate dehydrogenase E1 component beta subunit|nr:alpha-ketoacid dehydrogenase subunit beta [Chloroflexota bacterium]
MAQITYRQALQQALREEMARDERVFVMGEEIGEVTLTPSKVTEGLFQAFGPKRVRDTPISEEGFIGVGVGAATLGLRPVIEIMTINFVLVAMDQIINHAAKIRCMFGGELNVPMVIRMVVAQGSQLTAQHSQSFEGWFANTPGLKVLAPATPYDAKGLLKSAIRDDDPVIFLEGQAIYSDRGEVPEEEYTVPIGLANVLRQGTDMTIISHGYIVRRAMNLAERLHQEGIEAEVVDLRSLRPLDMETVAESVRKTHRALCIESGWPTYGVTAELAARIQRACFAELDAPVERVGGAEVPMPYARSLENAALVNEEKIYRAAHQVLAESGMLTRGLSPRGPGANGTLPDGAATIDAGSARAVAG